MLNDPCASKYDVAAVATAALHQERVEVPLAPRAAATAAAAIDGVLDVLLGLRRRLPGEHGLRGGETGDGVAHRRGGGGGAGLLARTSLTTAEPRRRSTSAGHTVPSATAAGGGARAARARVPLTGAGAGGGAGSCGAQATEMMSPGTRLSLEAVAQRPSRKTSVLDGGGRICGACMAMISIAREARGGSVHAPLAGPRAASCASRP